MLTPGFARRDLERSAAPATLARGRELATQVEDLDWDEYSVWGCLPGEGSPSASCCSITARGRWLASARARVAATPGCARTWRRWPGRSSATMTT